MRLDRLNQVIPAVPHSLPVVVSEPQRGRPAAVLEYRNDVSSDPDKEDRAKNPFGEPVR